MTSQLDPNAVQLAYQRAQQERANKTQLAADGDNAGYIARHDTLYTHFLTGMAALGYTMEGGAYYWNLHAGRRLAHDPIWAMRTCECPGCTEPLD